MTSQPAAALKPSVTSEIGTLREVILHRPDLELRRLTPANKDMLLFDELVWVAKAQEEHDGFADLLRGEGVVVHLLHDLLTEALSDEGVRLALIDEIVSMDTCGVELVDRVRGHLRDLPVEELARHLIGGVTVQEVPGAGDGFVGGVLGPSAFLVPPLPNAVFTRDPSAWIGTGVVLSPMHMPARIAERHLWRTIYRHHPAFAGAEHGIHYGAADREYFPATMEGGDILVLSADCVAVGLSERTHPIAVENMASQLFATGVAKWVLAVDLPKARETMHLDTIMTVVDRDAMVVWPRALRSLTAHRIEPGAGADGGRMRVREEPDLVRALAAGLGVDTLRVVTTGEDEVLADREQWDDGNNTLAIAPGKVVAYERNPDTNRRLEDAGVQVLTIPSHELPRGRGGPRCMSCPVVRDPL
ncbi:MAG TPA: arginine deiminase [Egibacteraceae bacterium]|nr:arginine deiminase [Egibacteraceae bacterium]